MKNQMFTTNKTLRAVWNDPVMATLSQLLILKRKELLRLWYENIYKMVKRNLAPGMKHIEIGAGSSLLYQMIPGLIRANILPIPNNDIVFNAYDIPFKDSSIDTLVLINVLHHMDEPILFFKEADRVLKTSGHLIINDPYLSLLSFFPWKVLHFERCDLKRIGFNQIDSKNPLHDANSATATLIFTRKNNRWITEKFKRKIILYHSPFIYWLAGGYNLPQFIPKGLYSWIKSVEDIMTPFSKILSSYLFTVLEKK